jgi:hypothetical protein
MIGQLVKSLAGHDKGEIYLVVAEDARFVYLSDGRLKLPDEPKKKTRKHIQVLNAAASECLTAKLLAGEKVEATAVKRTIKEWKRTTNLSGGMYV